MNYKTKVIVNPYSAFGKTYKRWNQIKEILYSIFKDIKYEFTEAPGHAVEITRESIKKGFEHILGVGGDGTFNEIVNGYIVNDRPLNKEAFLSIFPSGKGNDFLRTIKDHIKFKSWKQLFKNDNKRTIDVGKIETDKGVSYFVNVSSFGFSGDVVKNVLELREKIKYGFVYFLGALKALGSYAAQPVKIIADGNNIFSGNMMVGAVCNGRYFGGKMKVAPDARIDDGLFDLLVLKEVSKFELFKKLIKIYSGSHINDREVMMIRAKQVIVEPLKKEDNILIEYDGELGKILPAKFSLIPSVVKIKD